MKVFSKTDAALIVHSVNALPALVKALEEIIARDQVELATCVEIDSAGNTYTVEMIDGSCAQIARAALSAAAPAKPADNGEG